MLVEKKTGFTMVELLVTIVIIGILATMVTVIIGTVPQKARDTKRQVVISNIGRALAQGCYLPNAGANTYDLAEVFDEWIADNPKYAKYITDLPVDPKTGSQSETNYKYRVTADNHCVLYANLENDGAVVDLEITEPQPASGVGVLEAGEEGWNGSNKYYQYSR